MMEVDKKKTRTDEAWVRLYARFDTDCRYKYCSKM